MTLVESFRSEFKRKISPEFYDGCGKIYSRYYPYGRIASEYHHTYGERYCKYIEYYENGTVKMSGFHYNHANFQDPPRFGNRENGRDGGIFVKYYKNGVRNFINKYECRYLQSYVKKKKGVISNVPKFVPLLVKYYKNGYLKNFKTYKNKKLLFY